MRNAAFLGATALIAAISASPAVAATVVYTSDSTFAAAVLGEVTYNFPVPVGVFPPYSTYVLGPAQFDGNFVHYNDAYGTPYLGGYGSTFTVTTDASAIGFYFGSYADAQTMGYALGSITGTLDLPGNASDTRFLGFSGLSGVNTFTFTNNGIELDTIRLLAVGGTVPFAAVPEPATWAMMLIGFAGVGLTIRRRRPAAQRAT
jgi:hypothetical protein